MPGGTPWVCPPDLRIPDFIICGAMKCGTTSLHHLLGHHPRVFIPDREVHFFDIDDALEHPDFAWFDGGRWIAPRLENDPRRYWEWYARFFEGAGADQLVGEDSTVYIASERAAERIALQKKPIRTIVMFRHPTDRVYSEYWHRVRSGRVTHRFEDLLRYDPATILRRSLYTEQVRRFLHHLPREQVHFVLFEDFLERRSEVVGGVLDFLGLDREGLPEEALATHTNKARIPSSIRLTLLKNRLLREGGSTLYLGHLPEAPEGHSAARPRRHTLVNMVFNRLNPQREGKPPPMHPETRAHLDRYFERELMGFDELTGLRAMERWFSS